MPAKFGTQKYKGRQPYQGDEDKRDECRDDLRS